MLPAMTHDEVREWLDRYVAAWRSYDESGIRALFTDDAVYGYRPWDSDEHTDRGVEAIVAGWLESPDDASGWDAHYEPFAVDGDRAVTVGWSRYASGAGLPERTYHNAFLLRFDSGGRCAEFHEFYMLEGASD
jgi:ketosteroid isomerase-like protein